MGFNSGFKGSNYDQKRWNERMIVNLGVVGRIRKRILKKQMEECGLD